MALSNVVMNLGSNCGKLSGAGDEQLDSSWSYLENKLLVTMYITGVI